MNIYNINNKVVVEIEELPELIGNTLPLDLFFSVSKYDVNGCLELEPTLTGPVTPNFVVDLVLPDGKYNIDISGLEGFDNYNGNLNQDFFAIYNRIPYLVEAINTVICYKDCKNCNSENCTDTLLKTFLQFNLFLTCTGLVEVMPGYKKINCEYNEILSKACEYETFYGKFKFDYSEAIRKILAVGLIELYTREASQIRVLNSDITLIQNMFQMLSFDKCLYDIRFSLDTILTYINNAKCTCNE